MFFKKNPTDKYVMALNDGIVLVFEDKNSLHDMVDELCNLTDDCTCPFEFRLMAPGEVDKTHDGKMATESIFDGRKIANHDYINVNLDRFYNHISSQDVLAKTNSVERLQMVKGYSFFPQDDWRERRVDITSERASSYYCE